VSHEQAARSFGNVEHQFLRGLDPITKAIQFGFSLTNISGDISLTGIVVEQPTKNKVAKTKSNRFI
jgi:hypothetical protein